MGNIMVRMGVVIGILAAVQLGFFYVGIWRIPRSSSPTADRRRLSPWSRSPSREHGKEGCET